MTLISALLSFVGTSAFRMLWGEIVAWLNARQSHKQEIERIALQGKLDAELHARNLEAIRLQAELGEKTIRVQGEMASNQVELQGWADAIVAATKPTGIRWVDAWNASIRPSYATVALAMWILMLYHQDFVPSEWDLNLLGAVAGFFFADRSLSKRGK